MPREQLQQDIFSTLGARLDPEHIRRRLTTQTNHAASAYHAAGMSSFHLENLEWLPKLVRAALLCCGMLHRGMRNSMDYRVERIEHFLPSLPAAFDGLRILQISDPHFEGIPDGGETLRDLLAALEFDLCVLTGDYRFLTFHDYLSPLDILEAMLDVLRCEYGCVGILGNHDFLEMVPALEALGVKTLLNESLTLHRGEAPLHIAGVDDPHYYGAHDIRRALRHIPRDGFTLLLCHSPEPYAEAEAAGADLMLCGHTHAGQICLPGGIPLITNAACPRHFVSGPWRYGRMRGYTSRGTGSSGISVRFFCPPEVTLHTLRRDGSQTCPPCRTATPPGPAKPHTPHNP